MGDVRTRQVQLLDWYDEHGRVLPWRESRDPYRIWLSEIMLQQTRVETVIPYFHRFVAELPTIASVAQAEEGEVLKLWEGLGYYRRAVHLKRAAEHIVAHCGGRMPETMSELLELPGIGPYTAGAIASIAFDRAVPAADGNVFRILARQTGCLESIDSGAVKKRFLGLLETWIPSKRPGDFNEALMDLGATICLPSGQPHCERCPWLMRCIAHRGGSVPGIPVRARPAKRRVEKKTMFILEREERIALRKRPESGLLAGMWECPNADGWLGRRETLDWLAQHGISALESEVLPPARHVFTHVEWHMTGYTVSVGKVEENGPFTWASADEVGNDYAIPKAFHAYITPWLQRA